MFFKKDKELTNEEVIPKQVKCEECKHWIDKVDAQRIKTTVGEWWYCPMHKKPYEEVVLAGQWRFGELLGKFYFTREEGPSRYYKTIPAYQVEVDEKGHEIKKPTRRLRVKNKNDKK